MNLIKIKLFNFRVSDKILYESPTGRFSATLQGFNFIHGNIEYLYYMYNKISYYIYIYHQIKPYIMFCPLQIELFIFYLFINFEFLIILFGT